MRMPRSLLCAALLALVVAPSASAESAVVELMGPAVVASAPLAGLRAHGHFAPRGFGPRLASQRAAREQALVGREITARLPDVRVVGHLHTVLNALVVCGPARQLDRLARVPGVKRVWLGASYRAQTDRVPAAVGATQLWGGLLGSTPALGDGVRIGIIDDGIDISRPAFSGAGYAYPPGFPKGIPGATNGKVIVARAFPPPGAGARSRTAFDPAASDHGTHVAGIAAGASGLVAHIGADTYTLSGVAPRAFLGNYRVLTVPTPGFGLDGNGVAIAQAIDQAVADGMDVLNLSVGEPEVDPANDLTVRAIAGAAKAGVATVVAAGNDGDDFESGIVGSPGTAPDAITVAATALGRFQGVTLRVVSAAVEAADLNAMGATIDRPERIPAAWSAGVPLVVSTTCGGGQAGALVLVRGCTPQAALAKLAPGALGLVHARDLVEGEPPVIKTQTSIVLSVTKRTGARLAERAAGGPITVAVDPVVRAQQGELAGTIASFSSPGPAAISLALKPDVSAPGVEVVSTTPTGYAPMSGTSMATPAVTGAIALLRERHPGWSVPQLKSALMQTARPVLSISGDGPTPPNESGGGLIDVALADQTGLFAQPSALNFGLVLPGSRTRRTVTLSDAIALAGSWVVAAPGLTGPPLLDVAAGGSAPLRLELAIPGDALEGDRSGTITLTSETRSIAVRWWAHVQRPRLQREPLRTLVAGNAVSGDIRQGQARVSSYRWPAHPSGELPSSYPGRELVYAFRVPANARNAGIVTTGPVRPLILLARNENRLAGVTALPLTDNPYLEGYGRSEPVSAMLVPRPGRYFAVVESAGGAPGPFTVRLWVDDRTPPVIDRVQRTVVRPQATLSFRVRDSQSGVSPNDAIVQVDGREVGTVKTVGDRVTIDVSQLAPGRHALFARVSDLQETKNSENAAAAGLPNTRTVRTTFVVR